MNEKMIKNTTPEPTEVGNPEPQDSALIHPTSETPVEKPAEKPSKDTPERAAKSRTIEVLETAAPTTMTRNEAMKYIKYLREENEKLTVKVRALEDNVKSAFAKADYIAKSTEAIERSYVEQLDYVLSSINNVRVAIENSAQVAVARVTSIKKGI
jgi:hypothetical protein